MVDAGDAVNCTPEGSITQVIPYFLGVVATEELLAVGAGEGFAVALTAEGFFAVPEVVEGFALITMAVDEGVLFDCFAFAGVLTVAALIGTLFTRLLICTLEKSRLAVPILILCW